MIFKYFQRELTLVYDSLFVKISININIDTILKYLLELMHTRTLNAETLTGTTKLPSVVRGSKGVSREGDQRVGGKESASSNLHLFTAFHR